jgi:hypothetical protein
MLWWFIGVWLASGLLIPGLCLLGMAWRRLLSRVQEVPKAGHTGLYVLAGLIGLGAMALLFVGSFSDPIFSMRDRGRDTVAASSPVRQDAGIADTPAPSLTLGAPSPSPEQLPGVPARGVTGCGETASVDGPRREPAPSGGLAQDAAIPAQPGPEGVAEGRWAEAPPQTSAPTPQVAAAAVQLTSRANSKVAVAERGWVQRRAHPPLVRPYATSATHGVWLSAPAQNAGGNS